MMGAVIKTYYAEKMGLDPKDMFVVSVMPCTAKKFEIGRDDQAAAGVPDTDVSITTRELARMIKRAGIDFNRLPDEEFDSPMGLGSGAGTIFGATGGVMEAALRTAVATLTGKNPEKLEFEGVRGTQGIKEASYNVAGVDVKVAVASGTANAKKLLDMVKSGEKDYTFIEIMGCPGGCVNGGGQPFQPASVRNFVDLKALRAAALYKDDENLPVRLSHENEDIKTIYREYFGTPGSEKAHHALHTSYVARK
jgi:NADP-reducing hydrogenase subunit HndD